MFFEIEQTKGANVGDIDCNKELVCMNHDYKHSISLCKGR